MAKVPYRLYLTEEQMPGQWYNLRADMKEPTPPHLNPGTMQPITAPDLYPVLCEELAKQETDSESERKVVFQLQFRGLIERIRTALSEGTGQ